MNNTELRSQIEAISDKLLPEIKELLLNMPELIDEELNKKLGYDLSLSKWIEISDYLRNNPTAIQGSVEMLEENISQLVSEKVVHSVVGLLKIYFERFETAPKYQKK